MLRALFATILMCTVLSLAPHQAAAADESPLRDSVTVLDKTYCFAWAPADATCDVRLGEHPNAKRVLGMTICTGPVPSGIACDVTFPHMEATQLNKVTQASGYLVLPLFGRTICMGEPPVGTACDVALGRTKTASLDTTASSASM